MEPGFTDLPTSSLPLTIQSFTVAYARFSCLAGWFGLQVNFDSTAARKNQIRLTNRPQEFHFS